MHIKTIYDFTFDHKWPKIPKSVYMRPLHLRIEATDANTPLALSQETHALYLMSQTNFKLAFRYVDRPKSRLLVPWYNSEWDWWRCSFMGFVWKKVNRRHAYQAAKGMLDRQSGNVCRGDYSRHSTTHGHHRLQVGFVGVCMCMRGDLKWTCLVWAERSTPDNFWVPSHWFNSATGWAERNHSDHLYSLRAAQSDV